MAVAAGNSTFGFKFYLQMLILSGACSPFLTTARCLAPTGRTSEQAACSPPLLESLDVGVGEQQRVAGDLRRDRLVRPVIGAYPPAGTYDVCITVEDRVRSLKTIPKVPRPRKDPIYGVKGPLLKLWKKAK